MVGSLTPSFLERSLLGAGAAPPPLQSPTSHRPPNNSSTSPAFELRSSGRCLMYITTSADCATAARALGVKDTTVEDDRQSKRSYDPPGCYYEGGRLKMNRDGSNTGSCSRSDQCLCKCAQGSKGCVHAPTGATWSPTAPPTTKSPTRPPTTLHPTSSPSTRSPTPPTRVPSRFPTLLPSNQRNFSTLTPTLVPSTSVLPSATELLEHCNEFINSKLTEPNITDVSIDQISTHIQRHSLL